MQPLEQLHEVRRKGTDWLLSHVNEDGSVGPVGDADRVYYYRVPWTFAVVGRTAEACRMVEWIRRNMLSEDGDMRGRYPVGMFEEKYGTYPVANFIYGAQMLRQFDVAYRGLKFLLSMQDPKSGGFYGSVGNKGPEGEQQIFPACQGGMSCLMLGQVEAARRAGDFMKMLYELQPEIEGRLYSTYSEEKGLITDFPEDQAFHYVTVADQPWEAFYNGGIAAAFLARLHMATGDPAHLELARRYFDFSMRTGDHQFESAQVCKTSWGATLLYQITREDVYRNWALRMVDWYAERQFEDGHWENTKYLTPSPTACDNIEITAEFVVHVDTLMQMGG